MEMSLRQAAGVVRPRTSQHGRELYRAMSGPWQEEVVRGDLTFVQEYPAGELYGVPFRFNGVMAISLDVLSPEERRELKEYLLSGGEITFLWHCFAMVREQLH